MNDREGLISVASVLQVLATRGTDDEVAEVSACLKSVILQFTDLLLKYQSEIETIAIIALNTLAEAGETNEQNN